MKKRKKMQFQVHDDPGEVERTKRKEIRDEREGKREQEDSHRRHTMLRTSRTLIRKCEFWEF